MESVIEVNMKITVDQVVALESTVVAPRGPNAVWLPIPPNAAATSPLVPLCNNTTTIKNRETAMWMIVINRIICYRCPSGPTRPYTRNSVALPRKNNFKLVRKGGFEQLYAIDNT